jgi:hypothetical protein
VSSTDDGNEYSRLERLTRKIHAKLNDASVTHLFGAKNLAVHESDRRICYVRNGGDIVPPKQTGAAAIDDNRHRMTVCKTRVESCIAHLWAETDALADDLLDNLIAAICELDPNAVFGRYGAMSDEPGEAGEILRNYKYTVPFALKLPVPSSIKPLRVIAAIGHECGQLNADGSFNANGAPNPED